jgi:methyl-accepting chemotaxis protein
MKARSIRTELMLLTGLLVAAISLFMLFFFPARLERQATRALQAKAKAIADMAAFSVAPAVVFDDTLGLRDALAGVQANPDLSYFIVRNAEGGQLLAYPAAVSDSGRHPGASGMAADGMTWSTTAPIEHNGATYGTITIGLSLAALRAEVDDARSAIALVSLLVFLLGWGATAAISVLVSRPIRAIAATAEEVAAGDLSRRVDVAGHAEARQLGAALNEMLARIHAAQEELKAVNHTLEERVAQRTRELSRAKDVLQQSLEAAQSANRATSEFLANMSH